MEIEFKAQYTKQGMIRALYLLNQAKGSARLIRFAIIAILLVVLVISTVVFIRSGGTDWSRMVRVLVSLGFLLYFFLQPYVEPYRNGSQLWGDGSHPPFEGRVTDLGIGIGPREKEVFIPWERYYGLGAARDMISLISQDHTLVYFTPTFFASPQDWQLLKSMVAAHIKPVR